MDASCPTPRPDPRLGPAAASGGEAEPQATRVVVFAGGVAPDPAVLARVGPTAAVVAADLGLDHALAAGYACDVVVGDFDSVSSEGLARARQAGSEVRTHPAANDATDLELALEAAMEFTPAEVVVVGAGGGRLDHLLGNLLLLASDRWAGVRLRAEQADARVWVVRGRAELDGSGIEYLTLLPVGGAADDVWTSGLEYSLAGETLPAGTTRGVSNRFRAPRATVTVGAGVVLAIGGLVGG